MQIRSFINIQNNPKADFIFGLLAVNCLAAGYIFGFLKPGDIDTDGGIFAAVAMKDLSGGTLYLDAWENKPPGIFLLNELFLTLIPHKVYALFSLAVFNMLLTVNAFYFLLSRCIPSLTLRLLFSAAFILFTINNIYMGDGLYTEIPGTALMIWSLYAFSTAHESKHNNLYYYSLILAGTSFWFKEPFIFLALPVLIVLMRKSSPFRQKGLYLLAFAAPSLLFMLILVFKGSLAYYVHTLQYNFGMSSIDNRWIGWLQLEKIFNEILLPLALLTLFSAWLFYKSFTVRGERSLLILMALVTIGSLLFVIISPHDFNHYYLPLIGMVFSACVVSAGIYKKVFKQSLMAMSILLLVFIYRRDQSGISAFTLYPATYKPDKIALHLQKNPGKTLFIDLVDASEYYVKGGMLYPTFLPVPIAAHFGDNEAGLKNRKRIFETLANHKPDFLITTETASYMYWHSPDPLLYYGNYEKTDSLDARYGKKVILWKLKQH